MSDPAFLTPGQFRAFLERPDVPPMRRRDACDCPLARALEAVRGRRCEIGGETWNVDEEHGRLPVWAAELVVQVDSLPGGEPERCITAEQVRMIFDGLFARRGWCACCGCLVSTAPSRLPRLCTWCYLDCLADNPSGACHRKSVLPFLGHALDPAGHPPCHTCGAYGEHEDGCAEAEVES